MNVLTIAGTDPSGGAGIPADLHVIRDHGFHGLAVVTAVVWQNTTEVRGWRAIEADEVEAQLDAVLDDMTVDAIKIGMVGSTSNALMLANKLRHFAGPVVFDPVLTSGDGGTSMFGHPLEALRNLARLATLVTPNLPEAKALLDSQDDTPRGLAQRLNTKLGTAVLLKVGHLDSKDDLRDILADGSITELDSTPRIPDDVRGTGCQLSTAIACRLAVGDDLLTAVEASRRYLSGQLSKRKQIGRGRPVVVRIHE